MVDTCTAEMVQIAKKGAAGLVRRGRPPDLADAYAIK
jgi:hypothetical protein